MQEKWQLVECLTLITPRRHLKTQETLVIPVKTVGLDSKTPAKAIPAVSQFKGDDRLVPKKTNVSRSRRYDNGDYSKNQ